MNKLSVLSGADVSGSCYLVELNGMRILFDCGTKPNTSYYDHVEIPDPESIDIIFISHAHIDHMGGIAYAASVCKNAKIFVTPMTAELIRYQLSSTIGNYIGANTPELKYHNELLCSFVFNRVETVDFNEKYTFTSRSGVTCAFSFFRSDNYHAAMLSLATSLAYSWSDSGKKQLTDYSRRIVSSTIAFDNPAKAALRTAAGIIIDFNF